MLGEATGSTPQKANDALNRFSVSVHVHWCEGGGTSGHTCHRWQLGEGVWRTKRGAEDGKELAGAWRQGWGGAQPCKRLERGHEETARGASLSTGASSGSCRRGKALFPPVLTITASFRARGTNLSSLRPASLQKKPRPKEEDGLAEVMGQNSLETSSLGSPSALSAQARQPFCAFPSWTSLLRWPPQQFTLPGPHVLMTSPLSICGSCSSPTPGSWVATNSGTALGAQFHLSLEGDRTPWLPSQTWS